MFVFPSVYFGGREITNHNKNNRFIFLAVNWYRPELISHFEVYMTQKMFFCLFERPSTYRRMAFFFLKYLFSFEGYWLFSIMQIRSVMMSKYLTDIWSYFPATKTFPVFVLIKNHLPHTIYWWELRQHGNYVCSK